MRLIRWIFTLAVLSVWAALIGTALYVALYEPSADTPEGAAIVVLAGGADASGTGMGPQSSKRFETGLALFNQGAARILVVSGGGEPPVADFMAQAALAAGVPDEALLVENKSRSTLQNALFTADLERLDKAAPIILVTHRYHLPRANASFRWAGFTQIVNHAADPDAGFALTGGVMWEALKWPYNVLRAAAASAAEAGDVPRESYMKYLE